MSTADPVRIAMREASLGVIDGAMRASDRTRIQYADKQSGISNAYKKWIGELRGLKELGTLQRKRDYEAAYVTKAHEAGRPEYSAVIPQLQLLYKDYVPYATARDLFVEMAYYGPEVLRFTDGFSAVVQTEDHAFQVQKNVDDVFAHVVERRILMHYAGDLHLGRSMARHGGEQYAAQRVAERVAIAPLERLHGHASVIGRQVLDVDDTRLQKSRLRHL
jgi:hypothetical protein